MLMDWLLLATGFTGALMFLFLARLAYHQWRTPPSVAAYFSPLGGCTEAVVAEIQRAQGEILLLAYTFTSKPIAQALVDAKLRGVHVELILDKSTEKDASSDLAFFLEQGMVPLIDAEHPMAHNKVMLLDSTTLITGSFNFTHQAEAENAENLLVLKGHPDLISAYRRNFQAHKAHTRAPETKTAPATLAVPAASASRAAA